MRKKVCVVAMSLMLAFLVGNSFAGDGNLSFVGTGQDACGLINGDTPWIETGDCEECDNGCGSSFIHYDLNLTVVYNRVFGKLSWENCGKDNGDVTCNAWEESKLKNGRILKDKRFDNTYISFAVTSTGPSSDPCPYAVFRDYFMLLAIKDDSGNIIRLEGGAPGFENEDCNKRWEASEIQRVVLFSD